MATIELPRVQVQSVTLTTSGARPLLINRDPSPGEVGVPIDSPLALELVDPGAGGIDRSATRIWVDGVLAFDGAPVPPFAAVVAQSPDSLRVVLTPAAPLSSLARVTVRVASRTVGGGQSLDESWSFTAEDRVSPRLASAQAISQKQLRLVFDEPIESSNATVLVTPIAAPAVPLGAVHVASEANRLTVSLDVEMSPDVEHEVQVLGVTDLSGNMVLPPFGTGRLGNFAAQRPSGDGYFACRAGPIEATATPRLKTVTVPPFRAKSSSSTRHLAFNSVALIWRDTRVPPS